MEKTQHQIIFENTYLKHLTGWWKRYPYPALGSIIHWIYVYGTLNMAERIQVGDDEVKYNGKVLATIVYDDNLKMPIFSFNEEYEFMQKTQTIYIEGLTQYPEYIAKMEEIMKNF